jgi:hypothetical protein
MVAMRSRKAAHSSGVHLLGLGGAARGGGAAGRDRVDQHEMLRAMGDQRLAGAHRAVHHVVPGRRVVEGAEDDAANELEPVFGQRVGQHRRVFGHVADRAELYAGVAGLGAVLQHAAPVGLRGSPANSTPQEQGALPMRIVMGGQPFAEFHVSALRIGMRASAALRARHVFVATRFMVRT